MKMKIIFMIAALVVLALATAFSPVNPVRQAGAQNSNKEKRQSKAEKVSDKSAKGSGDDKNVTATRGKNSTTVKTTRTKTRGSGQRTCYIDLVNETGYVIDIYIDGRYRGTIGEYDANYTTTGTGATKLYARAEFDDGSFLYWGPRNITCGSNSKDGYYEWTLTE